MASFSERIQAGADDGYGSLDGASSWFSTFNSIPLGNAFSGNSPPGSSGFFRFSGVTIPNGAVINSAKLTFFFSGGSSNSINVNIYGIAEDNTANFSSDPRGRTRTTALKNWIYTFPGGINFSFDTADFANVLQEIVNRAGWASGNAFALRIDQNTSTFALDVDTYERNPLTSALLTVDYTVVSPSSSVSPSISPSASVSPSSSMSASPSPTPSASSSLSPSASVSPSVSPSSSGSASVSPSASTSASASPSPAPLEFQGMKIAKPGINVLETNEPQDLIFSSAFGTLKYFHKEVMNLTVDAGDGDITCRGEYTHNLGYYPYCEVFVRVYIGSPSGNYEYCPFFGSGASVAYSANVKITTDKITVYGGVDGVSSSLWHFDFLIFVFRNKIDL